MSILISISISIDYLHLDRCSCGCEYFLVVTDHFTRYTQTYPTRNKASRTAEERMFNDFILTCGMSKHVFHDKGKEFDKKFFHQLKKLCGFKQLRTILCHPQTNGAAERKNSTICSMLETLTKRRNLEGPHK